MSVNSPSSNDAQLFQNFTHPLPLYLFLHCITSEPGFFIFSTFNITNIFLLLPLCIFILYHGLQQYNKKRSSSSAAVLSHSDCFTFHVVMMELVGVSGCIMSCCGLYTHHFNLLYAGLMCYGFTWHGQLFFHILTCAERYLAVVHPITYLSLKSERWIRIRNISIACVWLLSIIIVVLVLTERPRVIDFFLFTLSAAVISFCSVSVLCVLIRPGPTEQVTGRERVDQSKQRAFYTIVTILGALLFRFTWSLYCSVAYLSIELSTAKCVMLTCDVWVNVPSSLVLPLLFLIKAGKITVNTKSEEK